MNFNNSRIVLSSLRPSDSNKNLLLLTQDVAFTNCEEPESSVTEQDFLDIYQRELAKASLQVTDFALTPTTFDFEAEWDRLTKDPSAEDTKMFYDYLSKAMIYEA